MKNLMAYAVFLVSGIVNAQTANFTVEGKITGSTCKVTGDKVQLRQAPPTRLKNNGDTYGKTAFKITVVGCGDAPYVNFQPDAMISSEGRLMNTAEKDGGAKNVELQIRNNTGTVMDINNANGVDGVNSPPVDVAGADSGTKDFHYFVEYYAIGQSTGGLVSGSVTFLVEWP